jgi:hypothetical protein
MIRGDAQDTDESASTALWVDRDVHGSGDLAPLYSLAISRVTAPSDSPKTLILLSTIGKYCGSDMPLMPVRHGCQRSFFPTVVKNDCRPRDINAWVRIEGGLVLHREKARDMLKLHSCTARGQSCDRFVVDIGDTSGFLHPNRLELIV